MLTIKLRVQKREADSLDVSVFMQRDGTTFQLAGTLRMHIGEWQLFGASLQLGLGFSAIREHLQVIVEGEEEALRDEPR